MGSCMFCPKAFFKVKYFKKKNLISTAKYSSLAGSTLHTAHCTQYTAPAKY